MIGNGVILFGNEVGSAGSAFELVDYADIRDSDQIYSASELTRGEWAIEFTLSEIEGYSPENNHRFFVFIQGQQVGFKDLQAGMEIANIYLDGWDDPNGASEGISAEELGNGSTAEIEVKIGNSDLTEIFVDTDESAPFILSLDLNSPVSEETVVINPNSHKSFFYLTLGEEIGESLTNEMFGLSDDVTLSGYTIQPATWMTGTGLNWLSVNSTTGELAGIVEGFNDYWQADYIATAQDSVGNSYTEEIAIMTNPFLDDDGELHLSYHHWSHWGQETPELTGAYANLSALGYSVSDSLLLAPGMVVEPDGTSFQISESAASGYQDSKFHGTRFDDVFVGGNVGTPQFQWTGGNDKFVGTEGVYNYVDFGWYKAYATGEFGEDHAEGVHLTIDNNDTVATTDFGVLEATNLQLVDTSHLDDVITLQNMAKFDVKNFGGTDTINANNIEINAKLYNYDGAASKYVINDYNQSSVIRIDDGITEDILGLAIGADYEAATSVYKADGKTYVDLVGANNQSIEKIITLDGDYVVTEIKDNGSNGFELRFGELDDGAYRLTEGDDDFTGSQFEPNVIYGLGGDDELTGGPFADQIYGGEGDDDFFATAGSDFYDGGGGFKNSIMYRSHDIGPIDASLTDGKITLSDGTVHTFENIQSIHGTQYDDSIEGDQGVWNLFFGNGGFDTFKGNGSYNIFSVNENWTDYREITSLDENKINIRDYGVSDWPRAEYKLADTIWIYDPDIDGTDWFNQITLMNVNVSRGHGESFHYLDQTWIGLDNGQSSTNDMIAADGSFELKWLERASDGDIGVNLASKTTADGADVFFANATSKHFMPDYSSEAIVFWSGWNLDETNWLSQINVTYDPAENRTMIYRDGHQDNEYILIAGNFGIDNDASGFEPLLDLQGGTFSRLFLYLDNNDGVDFGIKPSFGHEKKGFMDKLQSVKLKDKSEGSEFSIAEQMADTMMGSQKFQKNKTYELQIEHEQQTDGAIDIDDLLEVAKMVSGRKAPSDDIQKMAADWDGNGSIDIDDLLGVAKRVAGRVKDDDWKFYDNTNGKKLDYDPVAKVHKMDVVLEDNMEIDLSAILRGDVNASYEADTHDVAPTTQQPSPRIFSDIQSPQQEDILITQVDVV